MASSHLHNVADAVRDASRSLDRLAVEIDRYADRRTPFSEGSASVLRPPVDVPKVSDELGSGGAAAWASVHFPPDSLRGHAERALHKAGGPLSLDDSADRIRAQGFVHPWNPKNPRQL